MCRAVDELCHKHIIKGIASVPVGAIEKAKKKDFNFYQLILIELFLEMAFIHHGIVHLMFMKVLKIIYPIKQQ
jgi:hypothetical protein